MVSIMVVAYNSGHFLQPCLNSIAAQTFADFECLIADNQSNDGSIEALVLPDQRFRLIPMGANLGFATANNRLAEQARGIHLVLLNPDAQADPTFVAEMVAAAAAHPEAGAFGAIQVRLDEPDILDGVGDCWHVCGVAWRSLEGYRLHKAPGDGPIFGPCGAAALYRASVFRALGGFDERFFCYAEDVDFAFRLRLAGWSAFRAGKARVYHAGSGITGRASDFTLYHGHRNRIWTFLKNTPQEIFLFCLIYHIFANCYILLRAYIAGFGAPILHAYSDAWAGRRQFIEERKITPPRLRSSLKCSSFHWSPIIPRKRTPQPIKQNRP